MMLPFDDPPVRLVCRTIFLVGSIKADARLFRKADG
jgi:hypothetical protein